MSEGLFGKYRIMKRDGTKVDPAADYFVLRLDTDPAARAAARAYASAIEGDNRELSIDLRKRCDRYSWFYCMEHLRPHTGGWCSVGANRQVALSATSEGKAYAECRAAGFRIYGEDP